MFWAKGCVIKKDQVILKAYFSNISGLNLGDPVTVNGVKKGKVKEIELVSDSVLVTFTIEKDVKIRQDYQIEVNILEVMGGKQLFIYPGKSNLEIDYETPLYGTNGADIASMFKTANLISEDVRILISKFSITNDNLNKVLLNLDDLLGDKNMQRDLKSSIRNFNLTAKNINSLVTENKQSLRNLTDKAGNTLDNVNNLIDQNSPEFKKTFKEIQILTAKVDSLVVNVNTIATDITNKKSGLGKLMYNEKFFEDLNKTLLEIEQLTKEIREKGIKIKIF
jgi:phospholipid/cholesterol/gamma-HCH transport system substrate-binding protein